MRLDEIAKPGDFRTVVFAVIETAEQQGWTDHLIVGASGYVPGNQELTGKATYNALVISFCNQIRQYITATHHSDDFGIQTWFATYHSFLESIRCGDAKHALDFIADRRACLLDITAVSTIIGLCDKKYTPTARLQRIPIQPIRSWLSLFWTL